MMAVGAMFQPSGPEDWLCLQHFEVTLAADKLRSRLESFRGRRWLDLTVAQR